MQVEIKGSKIFAPLLNKWVLNTQEENLKQEFIQRLINVYGYTLGQLGQDVEIKKRYKADIAIWRSEKEKVKNQIPSIIITVECKAEHIKIKESDYSIGYNFASTINANFFIAVNLKEPNGKVFHILKDNTPKRIEKLADIPKAEILSDDKKIEKYIKETKTFTREEFTRLLTRCHNIIRNNDKLSPEAAFDEISKVLFMKIMYEREATEEMIFSKARFQALEKLYNQELRAGIRSDSNFDEDYMQILFNRTKLKFEGDGIFEKRDQIKIKRESFEMIVEELEAFNLSDTSDDVKGIAFEQFLGKTFRGELGQFFTPRTIVDYMVEILDPQEGETICDPCCGSGGFLITAFDYIRNKIDEDIKIQVGKLRIKYFENDYQKFEKYKKLLQHEFDLNNKMSRYYHLSHNCIYGTDANPRMARTAKMNMIMHGDGHGGVHHHDGLIDVNGVYKERFDIILTNPPFGARVEKTLRISSSDIPSEEMIKNGMNKYGDEYYENVVKPIKEWAEFDNGKNLPKGKSVLSIFDTGEMSSLTEVLFIERCLQLLRPGGRMGIVLPEGVLNNTKLQKVRDYVEGKAKIINITSIPQDVFIASGATVKPSLLFFKKFTNDEAKKYNKLKAEATITANEKHKTELEELETEMKVRGLSKEEKKELKDKYNQILQQIVDEIKIEVKTKFDYEIPIVEVEKAGISTTGAQIENELLPVAIEFKKYRIKNKLWKDHFVKVQYDLYDNKFQRVIEAGEPKVFYGKDAHND